MLFIYHIAPITNIFHSCLPVTLSLLASSCIPACLSLYPCLPLYPRLSLYPFLSLYPSLSLYPRPSLYPRLSMVQAWALVLLHFPPNIYSIPGTRRGTFRIPMEKKARRGTFRILMEEKAHWGPVTSHRIGKLSCAAPAYETATTRTRSKCFFMLSMLYKGKSNHFISVKIRHFYLFFPRLRPKSPWVKNY